jgi:hypothetical protein
MRALFLLCLALGATAPLIHAQDSDPAAPVPYRLIDLTGDDLADRVFLGLDGSISVSVNRGHGRFAPVWQELPAVRVSSLLATDLDGDGLTDLYLVSAAGNVALLGDGTGLLYDETEHLGLGDSGRGLSAERIDLDTVPPQELLLHNESSDVIFWSRGFGRFERDAQAVVGTGSAAGSDRTGVPPLPDGGRGRRHEADRARFAAQRPPSESTYS